MIDDRRIVWLDVHDSDHNRFELLQQEWSVLVREASDFRGHNDDFYFKTTLTSASELTNIRHWDTIYQRSNTFKVLLTDTPLKMKSVY